MQRTANYLCPLGPLSPTAPDDDDESKSTGELDEEAWRKMQSFEARSIDPQTLQEVRRTAGGRMDWNRDVMPAMWHSLMAAHDNCVRP